MDEGQNMSLVKKQNTAIAPNIGIVPVAIAEAQASVRACHAAAVVTYENLGFFGWLFGYEVSTQYLEKLRMISEAADALAAYAALQRQTSERRTKAYAAKLALKDDSEDMLRELFAMKQESEKLLLDAVASGNAQVSVSTSSVNALPETQMAMYLELFRAIDEGTEKADALDERALILIQTHDSLIRELHEFAAQHRFWIGNHPLPNPIML